MKTLFKKSNLIQLVAIVMSIIFAAGVVTYSWYLQDTDTEDVLQLQADGAQVIMFEAEVSEAALEGTLYPAKAKKSAYIDGTIPDNPQVIPIGGLLPDYIDEPAGIVTFDTNLTYYALGLSGKIRMEILSSTKIKDDPLSRDLQTTGEVNASYIFSLQDFYLSVAEDGIWNILSASFPSDGTIYTRGNKKYYEDNTAYIPLTGDSIVYNSKNLSSEYNIVAENDFSTNDGALDPDLRIYEYQVAFLRNGKKYIESYESYEPLESDTVIYINKVDSSCLDNKIENVLLNEDLVFYTRTGKNYIEKLSVYNSGLGATDANAMKTGDIINYINISNTTSPVKPVYLGSSMNPVYYEYYVSGQNSTRYVVSVDYWDEELDGVSGYNKISSWIGNTTDGYLNNGITFDENFVVFEREYSGNTYTCIDHIDSYVPITGDVILSYQYTDSTKVTFDDPSYTANLVDIRNSTEIDETDRDVLYLDENENVVWSLYSDADFSLLSDDTLLFANIVDTTTGRVVVTNYTYESEDPLIYTTADILVMNSVSFNDDYTLVKRYDDVEYVYSEEESVNINTPFYHIEKDALYEPQTLDLIYYNIYISNDILYDSESGDYTANDLDLFDEDLIYSRDGVRYIVKEGDYVFDEDDVLLYENGSAVGQELLTYDNSGYLANRIGLESDDTVYFRNGKIYVCTTLYYTSQIGDISLYSDGLVTLEGEEYIIEAEEGDEVDYYVDNVSLLVNDEVYMRNNDFRFIYKDAEAYSPVEGDNMIFDSGYMVADAQTRFMISGSVYITTLDQETSRDLIGATITVMLSMESPDIAE
ncbi:MAG: hypothetical protein GXY10_04775 [Clostridiales bacterium]|nr:hypothetical protein [Clostridiales bacterium]